MTPRGRTVGFYILTEDFLYRALTEQNGCTEATKHNLWVMFLVSLDQFQDSTQHQPQCCQRRSTIRIRDEAIGLLE